MASGASKFKFISPGIFINEIDESKLPADPAVDPGPTVIGRARRGPGMRPITVSSFDDFVRTFGTPDPGAEGGDNWRSNDFDGPTYGAYAAQAWLVSQQSPINYVRLLGTQSPLYSTDAKAQAGWITDSSMPDQIISQNGGAYGLFLVDSGSVSGSAPGDSATTGSNILTGTLAAVWYINEGAVALSGTMFGATAATTPATQITAAAGTAIQASSDTDKLYTLEVRDTTNTVLEKVCFNFDRASDKYIRKVFNTNAAQTNSDLVVSTSPSYYTYWLGETYDQMITETLSTSTTATALLLPLESGSVNNKADMRAAYVNAETPYFFGQDLGDSDEYIESKQQQLFKLVALDLGESAHRYKVSVANITAAPYPEIDPYGTFSVFIRRSEDSDAAPVIVERYDECNLNPLSDNYIARKVGDAFQTWDDGEGRFRYYGNYPNQSDLFRVVVDADVEAGGSTIARQLPVGFLGPIRYSGFMVRSSSVGLSDFHAAPNQTAAALNLALPMVDTLVTGGVEMPYAGAGAGTNERKAITACAPEIGAISIVPPLAGAESLAARYLFPTFQTRATASIAAAGGEVRNSYFGVRSTRTANGTTFDESYYDICRPLPFGSSSLSSFSTSGYAAGSALETPFVFSLDNIVYNGDGYIYVSGSRTRGDSFTAGAGLGLRNLLTAGVAQFTAPVHGGFDGLDITEREPFRNSGIASTATVRTNYALNTLQRAVATAADPERVVTNLITVPGVWRSQLTDDVINTCEDRGDALALIDIEDAGYPPATEGTSFDTAEERRPDVNGAVTKLRTRVINSSYACTYFPWVRVRDPGTTAVISMPPSVAALGTFASSQAKTELWFAPAGFVRGGLSNGAAGLPVVGVNYRLTANERDELYAANINPIAQFPNEGIVIFGQKTLQITRSALDRINVRRLMIFVKREISKMASNVLFDPNVDTTWARFTSQVNPFLASVKSRFGLSDFKVVLDKTTTTDDLVDRNIMYAKIFLKPTKAIEFIALDFIITRQGASFDD
jgi:hypothetical protein